MSDTKNYNGIWKIAGILIGSLITVVTVLSLFITTGLRNDTMGLRNDIKGIDSKLFTHLTNHEIHIPRDQVVSQSEFNMHCYTSEKNIERLIKEINN